MIRKFVYNKLFRTTGMLLLLLLLIVFPVSKEYGLEDDKVMQTVYNVKSQKYYLIDKDNYVARCNVKLSFSNNIDHIKKSIELLIIDGPYEDKIPNGFRPVLSSDTKVNDIKLEDSVVTVDIDTDFDNLKNGDDARALEAIIYNVVNIDGINELYIDVNGKRLSHLKSSNVNLVQPFTKNYGINKAYNLSDYKNASFTTVYYVSKSNKDFYYVPVTKINNDHREKIKIIVDELTSSHIYETNLMSFLNYNTKLLDYQISDDRITLNFNDYIFDDVNSKNILEEVIYSISLSVQSNYDVKEVIYMVNGEEIAKSTAKDIE